MSSLLVNQRTTGQSIDRLVDRLRMAVHWTYEEIASTDLSLMQGDILWPTDELKALFAEIHPHFCDPKYIGFIVITQSCDLLRRDEKPCKADYINLAVIRELESCLSQFLDNTCEKVIHGVYLEQSKIQAHQLLERILNQNEQALGLFYLHPNPDVTGIAEPAVALLRVSVAFRAKEHYDVLRRARKGRLLAEFQSKLGWLVGNLYSRVGTRDWSETQSDQAKMRELIHRLVDSELHLWITRSSLDQLEKAGVVIGDVPFQDLPSLIEKHRPIPFKEEIAEAAKAEVSKVLARLPDEVLAKFHSTSQSKGTASETITCLVEAIKSVLEPVPQKVKNRLVNNRVISRALNQNEVS